MTDGASPPPPLPPGSYPSPQATGQAGQSQPAASDPQNADPRPSGQQASGQQTAGQPAAGAPASGQAPASSSAQAQQPLPPELARAPAGTVVEAEAVARNPDGSVTLRTAEGDVRAELARAQVAELLRPGSRVTVELRNPTATPPEIVVTIRGGSTTAAQPAVTTSASGPPPTVPLTVGRILQAVAVPGPATAAQQGAGPQPGLAAAGQPSGAPLTTGTPAPGTPPGGGQPALSQPAAGAAPSTPSSSGAAPTGPPPPPQATPTAPPSAPGSVPGSAPGSAQAPIQQPPPPTARAVQSAYQSALGLTGRPVPGAATPVTTAGTPVTSGQHPGAAAGQGGATAGAGLAAATAATPGDPSGPRLPNGAIVTVRVLGVGEDVARFVGARPTGAQAAAQLANPTSSGTTILTGTVAGVSQSGRPVVATSVGHLALNATSDLRIGDRVALDVLASRVGDIPTAERSAPLSVLAREWPALEGAMRALQEALGPQAAAQITQAMVRPSPQMTAALLFFMSALKGGDMRSWFGQEATRTLERVGRGGLLSALAEDFQTLQRAAEPLETGWRAFLIPVVGEERRPIRLLTRGRRGGKHKDGDGSPDGTAFLVDLELSQLGPFRLDGLVHDDLVDLWIRTTRTLPAMMRHDIKALFDNTLDRTGIQGRLSFKATPVLPPLPIADLDVGGAGDTESLFA